MESLGRRLGFRCNQEQGLESLRAKLEDWGWVPLADPLAECIFSAWLAPPSTVRGRLHLNLFYLETALVHRGSDLAKFWAALEHSLHTYLLNNGLTRTVLPGGMVGPWALLGSGVTLDLLGQLKALPASGRLLLDGQGRMQQYPWLNRAGEVPQALVFTEQVADLKKISWRPVDPGPASVALFKLALNYRPRPQETLARLAYLTSHIPAFQLRYHCPVRAARWLRRKMASGGVAEALQEE